MSRASADIKISGKIINREAFDKLVKLVDDAGIRIGEEIRYADENDIIADMIAAAQEGRYLDYNADEASYGMFSHLEKGAQELNLNYIRESGGNDEHSPEVAYCLSDMDQPCSVNVDSDHNAMFTADEIIQSLSDGDPEVLLMKAYALKAIVSGESIGPIEMSQELLDELKAEYTPSPAP